MRICLLWLLACFVAAARAFGFPEPDQVVVLANSRESDSVGLAGYYAAARGIPEGNIIAIPMPIEETISWSQYVGEIHNPLFSRLLADGWIGARVLDQVDLAGRSKIELKGHRIGYLVTCRGVPLRIENSLDLLEAESADLPPRYRTNRAAVDSELSLLTRSNVPTSGVVTNPLYREKEPTARRMASVIRVSRLDGSNWESCRRLVDSAISGEKRGLVGRAYIDAGELNQVGEAWFASIGRKIELLGFDLDRESTRANFPFTARMDAAVLYLGWHSGKVVGPVVNSGFRFSEGAVAIHIHSSSAGTLRRGWLAALVNAGAAATVGNVYEPYLQLTHDLDLFFERIESGASIGEAAFYSLPGQSWQSILVGDPLYRPFQIRFEGQWSRRDDFAADGQYLVLRKANLLERDERRSDAASVLREGANEYPDGLALAFRIATEMADQTTTGWMAPLQNAMRSAMESPGEWGLIVEAAELLRRQGYGGAALKAYEELLRQSALPQRWQHFLIDRAMPLAESEGDRDRLELLQQMETSLKRSEP
jgi:uncharacterized protein (TIGR03790 family)